MKEPTERRSKVRYLIGLRVRYRGAKIPQSKPLTSYELV